MTTKSTIYTILCTLICLLVSSIMLIAFFVFKPGVSKDSAYLQVTDMQLEVGQYAQLDMSMSKDSNLVTCQTMDQTIAVVHNNLVYGVKEGVTFVKVEVKYKDEKISKLAQIIVNESDETISPGEGFEFDVVPVQNCEYKNGILFYQESSIFYIDYIGEKWNDNVFKVTINSDLKFSRELRKYFLADNKDGYMYFTCDDGKFTIALQCKYVRS